MNIYNKVSPLFQKNKSNINEVIIMEKLLKSDPKLANNIDMLRKKIKIELDNIKNS